MDIRHAVHRRSYSPLQRFPWLLLVACTCLLSMQQAVSSSTTSPVGQPAQQARSAAAVAARQALSSMLRMSLAGDASTLAQGYGAVQGARNWDKLAKKVAKPGDCLRATQLAHCGQAASWGFVGLEQAMAA
jgi:hypothetical protein